MGPGKAAAAWAVVLLGCSGVQRPADPPALANAPQAKAEATPAALAASAPATETSPAESASPVASAPAHGPSCDGRVGAGTDCGSGESCCARGLVPEGDVLYRKLDAGPGEKRHVRAFYLDKYEATVGRFRSWVAAGQPVPNPGDVLHDDGAGDVLKWPKTGKVQDAVHLEGGWKRYDTWTGGDDKRPKNNITWYTAAAFCRWDGGRLPTDVEWTRASRGGEEDRAYPWGEEAPTPELAVYDCLGEGNGACNIKDILPVGSKPKGIGRWGQYDLAGSMFEWIESPGRLAGADTTEKARGGGFCYIGGVDRRANTDLRPAVFREDSPETISHMTGVRCAYDASELDNGAPGRRSAPSAPNPGNEGKPAEQAPSPGGGGGRTSAR